MTISLRTAAIAVALASALGIVTSCGDDEPQAAGSAGIPTISKAEFAEVGNGLCEANGKTISARFEAMSTPPKPEEFQAAYDTMITESYKLVGQFLALGAPDGQAEEFYDVLVEAHTVTETVDSGGSEAFFAIQEDPWADVTSVLVDNFGLTACQHED